MNLQDRSWDEYKEKFASNYDELNYTIPLQAAVMRASHKLSEKAFKNTDHFDRVLEIGAGTGEHLPFVRHGFTQYVMADFDGKALELARRKLQGRYGDKVLFEVQTGEALTYPDRAFDRVIAIHVWEHIYPPEKALAEWCRVLKAGGVLSIILPTDPGLAWRLGKCLGPRRNYLARGIAYDYVMAREHVNSCHNLTAILRHYFPQASEAWWPFPLRSINLNLFYSFHAKMTK